MLRAQSHAWLVRLPLFTLAVTVILPYLKKEDRQLELVKHNDNDKEFD